MTTTFGRMVNSHERLPLIKSRGPFIIWSCKITWNTKSISLLLDCLLPPNLVEWWLTLKGSSQKVTWPFDHMVLRNHLTKQGHFISAISISVTTKRGREVNYIEKLLPNFTQPFVDVVLPKPRHKLKQLYLYYQNAYGHQIQQCRGLPWGSLTHKVIWNFNTWSSETTQKTKSIISPLTIPIVTKLVRVLNYYLRLPPLMSSDLLITWPTWCQMTNWKIYISTLTDLWSLNLAGRWGGSAHKHLSCYQLLVLLLNSVFLDGFTKVFYLFHWLLARTLVTSTGIFHQTHQKIIVEHFSFNLKFRKWEHDM